MPTVLLPLGFLFRGLRTSSPTSSHHFSGRENKPMVNDAYFLLLTHCPRDPSLFKCFSQPPPFQWNHLAMCHLERCSPLSRTFGTRSHWPLWYLPVPSPSCLSEQSRCSVLGSLPFRYSGSPRCYGRLCSFQSLSTSKNPELPSLWPAVIR